VSLEKLLASAKDDPEIAARARVVMDAAFRDAHTLKGMGASMGYSGFAELAHRLEDLADIARQGQSIGRRGFDLLLEGTDGLEHMVERVVAGDEDPGAGDLPGRVQAAADQLRTSAALHAEAGGRAATPGADGSPFIVTVRIAKTAPLPQVRALVVHKGLSTLAGWQHTDPPPESLRTRGLAGRTLVLRFDRARADAERIVATARGMQDVADVTVSRDVEKDHVPTALERAAGAADRSVRVRTALLDEFIDSVGELMLARSRMRALASRVDLPELADLVDEVERLTRDLHGRVVAARMLPLSSMVDRLPRIVRDLARQSNKSIDFGMDGTEIELDRAILDELGASFLHMLRNAVDHAHEGDVARQAAGKTAAMKLHLRAQRERDIVLLELEDDGAGLDPARIRHSAVERGLIEAGAAAALTDAQALELICLPGFSTAEQVSQTSGRGVGMDVVRATLERLGGSLKVTSQAGQGTKFVCQLPLTVAIIQALVVEAGEEQSSPGLRDAYAIPVARVEQAVDLDVTAISTGSGRAWMRRGDNLLPLFDLSRELGYAVDPLPRGGTVILVGRGANVAALRVDAILGQEEVVAKPLGAPLSSFAYLSGATLLADGRAAFILEPIRLLAGALLSSATTSLP
jgi:two-component system chemotaxis sensor kinase CheA